MLKKMFRALLVLGIPAISWLIVAQAQTAEQLEIFNQLPADQQQSILETLGNRGSGSSGGRSGSSSAQRDRDVRFPDVVRRTNRGDDDQDDFNSDTGIPREPKFKPSDTLLLSLDIVEQVVPSVRQPMPPAGTAPQSAQGAIPPTPATSAAAPKVIERTDAEKQRLEDLRTRILRRNPFQIDKSGVLNIPELGPISIGGLTPEQARKRIAAEPLLADFQVGLTYLPVKAVGIQGLKPFGYDMFEGSPSTFAPATDVPVPAEYVVGPGDIFEVQLIGSLKGRYSLTVNREGSIAFPELGPITVAGMRFNEARALVQQRVSEQLIGTQVSIQMGELRSIRVLVVGDARQPGSYTVSGLSTITNVLFVSGGVSDIGSLRNIELKRDGQVVSRLDLYDLLLRGDTRSDARLLQGDVIFIPPVGRRVGISGEVRRPAIYELKGEAKASDLIQLAGGLNAEADPRLATLERVDGDGRRVVVDVDQAGAVVLKNGDMLKVPLVRATINDAVMVYGQVFRPGEFQYHPGMRISDVLSSLDELKPMADQHYVLIRREAQPSRRIVFVSVDLAKVLENRGSMEDCLLSPRDQLYVFDMETGRDRMLQPLMRELRLQSTFREPTAEVGVGGRVNAPGQYPLEPGMRVSDLIRAGGALSEAAYGGTAELTRNAMPNGETRKTELVNIDLAKAVAGDPSADVELRPSDYLVIKELPQWGAQEYVEVMGEVRFPGRFPIQRGETLKSVIQRAGGMTDLAFVSGAVFTRETLKDRERQQLELLTKRLQGDLAQAALSAAQDTKGDASQALAIGQQLLANLSTTKPVGRLVVNMQGLSNDEPSADVILKNGDKLVVPRITQEVTVLGEVQSPTSHLYNERLSRNDYIRLSGGATPRANKDRAYIVRADGSVVGGGGKAWYNPIANVEIQPGDTIVVPLDTERVRLLPLLTQVTTILYNLAITVAAVNSF
jgi:protein involved in polysaccharide export with SLBB domain